MKTPTQIILLHGRVSKSLLHHSRRIYCSMTCWLLWFLVTPLCTSQHGPSLPPIPPLSHWFNSLPFYLWALVKAFRCKTFGFHWYKLMTDAKEVDKLFSPATQRWNSLLNWMCSGAFIPSVHTGWLILFALNNSVIERYQTQYLVRPIIYLLCGKQVQTDHRL